MEPFTIETGIVAPLPFANIDTDIIMPKEFLKSIKRTGFGQHVFASWRQRADFPLNLARYQNATILLAGDNFGCGSSREHAVWGLKEYGFRVIIAPSFAEIFYNNCIKNAVLPISLPVDTVDKLISECQDNDGFTLTVDLPHNHISLPTGQIIEFKLDAASKNRLIQGLDDIDQTLKHKDKIKAFEQNHMNSHAWMFSRNTQ